MKETFLPCTLLSMASFGLAVISGLNYDGHQSHWSGFNAICTLFTLVFIGTSVVHFVSVMDMLRGNPRQRMTWRLWALFLAGIWVLLLRPAF